MCCFSHCGQRVYLFHHNFLPGDVRFWFTAYRMPLQGVDDSCLETSLVCESGQVLGAHSLVLHHQSWCCNLLPRLLLYLSILWHWCQQVVQLLPVLLQSVACLDSGSTNLQIMDKSQHNMQRALPHKHTAEYHCELSCGSSRTLSSQSDNRKQYRHVSFHHLCNASSYEVLSFSFHKIVFHTCHRNN